MTIIFGIMSCGKDGAAQPHVEACRRDPPGMQWDCSGAMSGGGEVQSYCLADLSLSDWCRLNVPCWNDKLECPDFVTFLDRIGWLESDFDPEWTIITMDTMYVATAAQCRGLLDNKTYLAFTWPYGDEVAVFGSDGEMLAVNYDVGYPPWCCDGDESDSVWWGDFVPVSCPLGDTLSRDEVGAMFPIP